MAIPFSPTQVSMFNLENLILIEIKQVDWVEPYLVWMIHLFLRHNHESLHPPYWISLVCYNGSWCRIFFMLAHYFIFQKSHELSPMAWTFHKVLWKFVNLFKNYHAADIHTACTELQTLKLKYALIVSVQLSSLLKKLNKKTGESSYNLCEKKVKCYCKHIT